MTTAPVTQARQTNSPFGLTFSVNPDAARIDGPAAVEQAFVNAAVMGRNISFFWDWTRDDELPALVKNVALAKARGFEVVINVIANAIPGIIAPDGYAKTFGNAATADKYVADVAYLAGLHPADLNVFAEVNLLAQYSPDEYAKYVPVYQRAYDAVKAVDPAVQVGASFLDLLWVGYKQQALPNTLGPHDFIGITSYPSGRFGSVSEMPADWYSQWRAAYPTDKLLLTEVGWDTSKPGAEAAQAEFIAALPKLLQYVNPQVVAYALEYDGNFYDPDHLSSSQTGYYANTLGVDPTTLFSAFNHTGLFNVDGSAKPAWQAALDLAFDFKPYQEPGPGLAYFNATQQQGGVINMDKAGPGGPDYLQWSYIYSGSDNIAMTTSAANVFIHTGSGSDAIEVTSGQNVLDGGSSSNFLTGGSGTDTFFTDARNTEPVWNTIRNFHAGDAATLWGFDPNVSKWWWDTGLSGATGYEGATLRANIVGGTGRTGNGVDASVTFTGLSVDQAHKLVVQSGTVGGADYLYFYNPGV